MMEFNNEMTFRNFNRNERKDTDKISEHNLSMVSNRDIENLNDITFVFTDGRKSDFMRESVLNNILNENMKEDINIFQKAQELKNSENKESNNNGLINKPKLFSTSDIDDFLTKNKDINNIKI